ncbi:MAG: hypothetical protein GY854_15555 [Deltaproteobacteria bacterium]|nr:hypothetical protein [Deltaproteobacteria bacterium]
MGSTAEMSQPAAHAKPKRHMRNFLLDKRFQLRWVLRVVFAASVIVAVMGYFLYRTVGEATDQMLAQKLGDPVLTQEALEAYITQAEKDKREVAKGLIGGLVFLVLLLGVLTIVATHKIAGPVYKMRKLFSSIDGRNLQLWAKLRKADELQEAFVDFDNMLRRIREHRQEDTKDLESIRALLAEGKGNEQAIEQMEEIIARFHASVKMD